MADDVVGMAATLPWDLRGLRIWAILLIGSAGGLRRNEIVSLDAQRDDTPDSGWIDIFYKGALLTLNAKTGWRDVELVRGSGPALCARSSSCCIAVIYFGPGFARVAPVRPRSTSAGSRNIWAAPPPR